MVPEKKNIQGNSGDRTAFRNPNITFDNFSKSPSETLANLIIAPILTFNCLIGSLNTV